MKERRSVFLMNGHVTAHRYVCDSARQKLDLSATNATQRVDTPARTHMILQLLYWQMKTVSRNLLGKAFIEKKHGPVKEEEETQPACMLGKGIHESLRERLR